MPLGGEGVRLRLLHWRLIPRSMSGWRGGRRASPTVHLLVFSGEHTLVTMNVLYFCNRKRVIRSVSFGFQKQTPEPGRGGRRLHLTLSCDSQKLESWVLAVSKSGPRSGPRRSGRGGLWAARAVAAPPTRRSPWGRQAEAAPESQTHPGALSQSMGFDSEPGTVKF